MLKLWCVFMREAMGLADLFLDASGAGIPVDLVMDALMYSIFAIDLIKDMKSKDQNFVQYVKENKEMFFGFVIELIPVVDTLPGFLLAYFKQPKSKKASAEA